MKKIKVYTTSTCIHCTHLKQWLHQHKFKYQEFDVGNDLKERDFIVKKSGQLGVPVVIITSEDGGQENMIIGFSPEELQQQLNI